MMRLLTLFTFLAFCGVNLFAQLPGGVGNPELWFQTLPVGNRTGVYHWQDFSGDSLRLNIYDGRGADCGKEFTNSVVRFYNGHPALAMEKLNDMKSREVQLKNSSLSQATVIGAFAPAAGFDAAQMLYALNGRAGQGVFVGTDKVYPSRESGKTVFDYGETEGMDLRYSASDAEPGMDAFRETSLRIASYYRSVSPATGVWGERERAVLSFNGGYLPGSNVNHNSTWLIPAIENIPFTGYIPEIVVYSRLLSPLERRRVESYLALKYGISLPVSYMGSNGDLLWDYAAGGNYNHRITAVCRDDQSGLLRRESATSYEEKPHYTDVILNDYYHLADPDNRSSSSRLLTVGREDGNRLSDGEYLFWGDNNETTTLESGIWMEGLRRMNRQWLVKTNMVPEPKNLSWTVNNLEFKNEGALISILKTGGAGTLVGTAFTTVPLSGSNGYLGVSDYVITGGLTLRFGAKTPSCTAGSHDYGYFIDSDFQAYKIEKGTKQASSFAPLVLATTIEVEKTESSLWLRVNGILLPESEIVIEQDDRGKAFYGATAVDRGVTDAGFHLRYGGFTDTGNRVELSFACVPDFIENGDEKCVLVVDRSGTGDFRAQDVEYIPVAETDLLRTKLVFHNVFFDRDGNGSDVFTFAYGKTDVLGNMEIDAASCGQSNGGVRLKMNRGVRGFNYTLKNTATGDIVREGWEESRTIAVSGIATGNYELTVSESGGYTFETAAASSGKLLRAKTTNVLPAIDGNIPFRVSNLNAACTVGYTASTAAVDATGNIFHYGLKQSGNKLYKVENGKETLLNNVSLQTGDELKIVKGLVSISYYRNGVSVGTSIIRLQDYGLSFYGLIDFGSGPTELLNVKAEGFFNLVDYRWSVTSGVTIMRGEGIQIKHTLEIPNDCGLQQSSEATEVASLETDDEGLQAYSVPGSGILQVKLKLKSPLGVSLLVYDTRGTLVAREELATAQVVQTAEIALPHTGVYIVKALTTDGTEYGKKTIVH